MKKDIHPSNYRPVVFQDLNHDQTFITKSTVETKETIKIDGTEYPLVKVHISSASHPFFTGQEKLLDIEGRVDKFKARQQTAGFGEHHAVVDQCRPGQQIRQPLGLAAKFFQEHGQSPKVRGEANGVAALLYSLR